MTMTWNHNQKQSLTTPGLHVINHSRFKMLANNIELGEALFLETFIIVEFEVLTAVVMKSYIFWDTTPCSLLKVHRRFGRTCSLHLQGRRISRARNQRESRWQAELLYTAFYPRTANFSTFCSKIVIIPCTFQIAEYHDIRKEVSYCSIWVWNIVQMELALSL
jgi:hypothetical protein